MMKTRIISSTIIFISAYAPLALVIAIKDFNLSAKYYFENPMAIFIILAIALLSVVFLFFVMKQFERGSEIKIISVENRSSELVNYTIPYMISFFGFDVHQYGDIIAFILFMVLLCLLTIKTQSIFVNPFLAFFGYGHYNVKYDENGKEKDSIILSRYKPKVNCYYEIDKLTDYTYIITKEK